MKMTRPYRGIIAAGVVVLVVALVYVALQKLGLLPEKKLDTNANVKDTAEGAVPTDGSDVSAIEEEFEDEAQNFANAQYAAMDGLGTDEDALMVPLLSLTGAQLIMIYEAFGVRDGKSLFQWYSSELDSYVITGGTWYDETLANCNSYFDNCSQIEAMRDIWAKSGLPITF